MNSHAIHGIVFAICAAAAPVATAHDTDEGQGRLGKVAFQNSCNPRVQEQLLRGVAMLHSFWYSEGEKTFRAVLAQDPSCSIATWGIASLLMSNPLAGQGASPKGAEMAQALIALGRQTPSRTQRERDYLEAVAAYYEDWANLPERARQQARAKAYEALAERYRGDDEAQIFSALYIAGTQAASDQSYSAYLKAVAILEPQFAKHPDHPGVAHYLIHSYDAPPIADKGLTAARRYAGIAPAAPHALHMPSHIFTRVGAWEESAATNARSAAVAVKGDEPDEAYHASDYMAYAYLQMARDEEARRAIAAVQSVTGITPSRSAAPYAIALMPARYAVERGAWKEAMQLQPQSSVLYFPEASTYFARGLGAVHSGDLAEAQNNADALAAIHKRLLEAKNAYWAGEVEVQRFALAAWLALAGGKQDDALKLMRAAADNEDRSEKNIVTPGRLVPARELLGEMLLEVKQPALALVEFEASQQREPNRFRGFYGAARAADGAGDRAKAAAYYRQMLALASKGDGTRPELVQAKAYLVRP